MSDWPSRRSASTSTSCDSSPQQEVHPLLRCNPLRPCDIFGNGAFPLTRAVPFHGGLSSGMAVKKRRSSSSPEDSHYREKIPHLEFNLCRSSASEVEPTEPSTSSGQRLPATAPETPKNSSSDRKDVNLTAELFWLKTQLSEHWSMKWLWQVRRQNFPHLHSLFPSLVPTAPTSIGSYLSIDQRRRYFDAPRTLLLRLLPSTRSVACSGFTRFLGRFRF